MWTIWWVSLIVIMIIVIACILHLQGKFSEKPLSFKITFFTSITLFLGMFGLAAFMSSYQPPWEGTGKVISKKYHEAETKRGLVGKVYTTRSYPECYGLYIVPSDSETGKVKFTRACVSKESWDSINLQETVTIDHVDGVDIVK